jgi:hypothetical protein
MNVLVVWPLVGKIYIKSDSIFLFLSRTFGDMSAKWKKCQCWNLGRWAGKVGTYCIQYRPVMTFIDHLISTTLSKVLRGCELKALICINIYAPLKQASNRSHFSQNMTSGGRFSPQASAQASECHPLMRLINIAKKFLHFYLCHTALYCNLFQGKELYPPSDRTHPRFAHRN